MTGSRTLTRFSILALLFLTIPPDLRFALRLQTLLSELGCCISHSVLSTCVAGTMAVAVHRLSLLLATISSTR